MASFLERHKDKLSGVLSCFDRIVIQGTLPGICYARGMTDYLYRNKIRIFDYPRFAQGLRDEIRENAERMAKEHGITIEFIRKTKKTRKEKLIKEVLAKRGDHPGLVHSLSRKGPFGKEPSAVSYQQSAWISIKLTADRCWLIASNYSLHALKKALDAANRRYLEFISSIDDPTAGMKKLDKISQPATQNGRNYKGFNLFASSDQHLFEILVRGEHNLSGMRNKDIRKHMADLSPAQVSRIIKRLRTHGILKRVGRTYKYYLTKLGRQVTIAGLKIKSMVLIPQLAAAASLADS